MFDESAVLLELDEMPKAKGSPKGLPEPDDTPKTLFATKGRSVWFEWLKEYADSIGLPVANAIDVALREQAKRDGFTKPMPKRMR